MSRSSSLLFTLLLVAALAYRGLAAIGDQFAFERVLPEPRICIQDGCLMGKFFNGLEGDQFEAYLGVPFAKPPVGRLRFRNPVRNDPWNGDYDATWERSRCVQKNDVRPLQTVQGGEDCLYLNVYRPKNVTGLLAVIFFIHGGAFISGSSFMGEFGPERFMDTKKVILVTPQYRLGVFGFLSTEDRVSPGNYGLKDQNLALRWTQRNIAYFGGDPDLVTIAGQSSGSSSVQHHMMSPLSRGLFARAISMSGSALGFWHYDEDKLELTRRQAEVVGIENARELSTEELVERLRKVPALELARSIDKLKYFYVHPVTLWQPTVERCVDDETFLSEDPRMLWESGNYFPVPYTVGLLDNEGSLYSSIILSNRSLLNELNDHSVEFIPRIVGAYHPTSVKMLKDRFFPDGTDERWLTEENLPKYQKMVSEGVFYHSIIKTIKQGIAQKSRTSPLSVFYFNFTGPYTQSYYDTYTFGDFGIVHADELLYLFRGSAEVPDFVPGSPAWQMSKIFVDYYVNIAYNGLSGPLCTAETCQLLEFTNSDNPNRPVELDLIDGFDEEMYAFWDKLYALQHY